MFSGSSCNHTTSDASLYFSKAAVRSVTGHG